MTSKVRLEKVLEPGQIGKLRTKNRMVRAPASTYVAPDGFITEQNIGFYESMGKSGVSIVFVEMACVDFPSGYPGYGCPRLDDDKFIAGFSEVASVIKKHDALAFLQLTHSGPRQPSSVKAKVRSASDLSLDEVPIKSYGATSGLTVAEIEDLVEKFARAAERAKRAGFDGVDIHGAHGYLVATFLSRFWNRRQDNYGGSPENRARLACEIVKAIKQRVGQDFPVGMRISGAEYGLKDCLTLEETQAMAPIIEKSGLDYFHVSGVGWGAQYNRVNQPDQLFRPEPPKPLGAGLDGSRHGIGGLTLLAAGVKQVVSVPVITVGKLNPMTGEEILRKGRADFVAFARCLIVDPDIIHKAIEGRFEDIRPCTSCIHCMTTINGRRVMNCRANAAVLHEREYVVKPAEKKKRVMIVGGGPAGMEAARVAATRGHEVTLYEREPMLGGAMLVAAMVKGPIPEDIVSLAAYFKTQLRKLGVTATLGKEVTPAVVSEVKPDVVILASGGVPALPDIPGIDKSIVVSQAQMYKKVKPYLRMFGPVMLRRLTRFYLPVGKRVVIIGGGVQGIQLAEFLIKRGRQVTVTETSGQLATGMVPLISERVLPWLAQKGCRLLTEVKYEAITDKGLTLITKDGTRQTIEADTILPALELKPNTGLFESLKGQVPEVYVIGDAKEGHLIIDAISSGFKTALTI